MIAGYTGTQQRATYTCVGDREPRERTRAAA
jgi:hypothetical protein